MSALFSGLMAFGREAIGGLARGGRSLLPGLPVIESLRDAIPKLENEAIVRVTGQPGHTKQNLYFLALAAANSVCRQFVSSFPVHVLPPPGLLMIEYDAAQNWVQCTIRYQNSMLPVVVTSGSGLPGRTKLAPLVVYNGPNCDVVGAPFDFTGLLGVGIPSSDSSDLAPPLPWNGRTILTQCPQVIPPVPSSATDPKAIVAETGPPSAPAIPTPNPKPPGDNRSRGVIYQEGNEESEDGSLGFSAPGTDPGTNGGACCPAGPFLIQLVYAALSFPGNADQMLFTGPTSGPEGS